LSAYHTLGVVAQAAQFLSIETMADMPTLLAAVCRGRPYQVIGQGSNVFFTSDYPGLVVQNNLRGIERVSPGDGKTIDITVAAGESWHDFVCYCVKNGYGGVENLSLIPGTVGAAPVQNIGAYGVQLDSVFHSLTAIDLKTGKVVLFDHAACAFGYRDSLFKQAAGRYLITTVTFRLSREPVLSLSYGGVSEAVYALDSEPTIRTVSQAIIQIRQSKLPDPAVLPNAGSFFKNPVVDATVHADLCRRFPKMPFYKEAAGFKIPAAWLIAECGWKNHREHGVWVYDRQPLVLVNESGATGAAIAALAHKIQKSVMAHVGIDLVPEVAVISV
jgi:UDP-N-acetylmuramate dehydrogenase